MRHRFFVFRHGQTDWNREGRFQGHLDIPINETGREQARALAETLHTFGLEAILSSDLTRAQQTATIVAERVGVPIFLDQGLREAHLGEAQGLTRDEIVAKFGHEALNRWRSSQPQDADIGYTGGETARQVMQRAFATLEKFVEEQPFERIGVSTHGGVIRRIMERILREEKPVDWHPDASGVPIPNGVLYEIGYDGKKGIWRVMADHHREKAGA